MGVEDRTLRLVVVDARRRAGWTGMEVERGMSRRGWRPEAVGRRSGRDLTAVDGERGGGGGARSRRSCRTLT